TYQNTSPMFQASCIVNFRDDQSQLAGSDLFSQYMDKSDGLKTALRTAPIEYHVGTVNINGGSVEGVFKRMQSDGVLSLVELEAAAGAGRIELQYRASRPSDAITFLAAWSQIEVSHAPTANTVQTQLDTLETVTLLKTKSEKRIFDLRTKLFDMPVNQASRWVEGQGLVSVNKTKWDELKAEANQLHERKLMLGEKLIEFQAALVIETGGKEDVAGTRGNMELEGQSSISPDIASNLGLSLAEKIEYLEAEINQIFEKHLEISGEMRSVARTIDVEEQVAFKEFTLRREMEQELAIRDALLSRLTLPAEHLTEKDLRIQSISDVSEAVQVSPQLSRHLMIGGCIGGCVLGFLSLFICVVGFDD
ncbi:MAG: hypothetical protein L7U72_02560, partial [Rubripirellula sp.]|nr:hypothetical protein [Rubripirellula sp.]